MMKKTLIRLFFCLIWGISVWPVGLMAQNTEGGAQKLPQLPPAVLKRLWDSCTLIDYTFYALPFSMSIEEKEAVQQAMRHIGSGKVPEKTDCKPFARIFYQIKGTVVMQADMFFANTCTYCVYYFHGKPLFANAISTEGIQFFNTIIENQKRPHKD